MSVGADGDLFKTLLLCAAAALGIVFVLVWLALSGPPSTPAARPGSTAGQGASDKFAPATSRVDSTPAGSQAGGESGAGPSGSRAGLSETQGVHYPPTVVPQVAPSPFPSGQVIVPPDRPRDARHGGLVPAW